VTGSTESVFVIETSASALTVVPCVALLFPAKGSDVVDVTVAVFDRAPELVGVTTTETVAFAPLAIVPSEHVSVLAATAHEPCDGVAETNVTPAGSGSEIETFWASDGPPFVAVSV
jgi:hypothetical protein